MKKKIIGIALLIVCCGFNIHGVTYKIMSIISDSNVTDSEGGTGIRYLLDVDFEGLKGKEVRLCADLFHRNNGHWERTPFSNKASAIYDTGGGVWSQGELKHLSYEEMLVNNYMIFFPYNAIVHPQGEVQYQIRFFVLEESELDDEFILNADGGYYDYDNRSIIWNDVNTCSDTFDPN